MISFEFNELQQAVKEEFSFFASHYLRPYAAEADLIGDVPQGLLQKPEALSYMRACIPREFGGGYRSLIKDAEYNLASEAMLRVIMSEEIAYGDTSLYVALPGPSLAEPVLRAFGSPEQQKRLFGIFLGDTPRWAAFAMSEPGTGSDVAAITTTAVKSNGRYVINGRKWFIGNGARADWVVVFATLNPKQGQFGLRAFIVERGSPGFRVGRILPSMGMRAVQLSELIFEGCEVGEENLLAGQKQGRGGGGFQAGMRTFHLMRPGVAAMAVGAARSALEKVEEEVTQVGARHCSARRWRDVGSRIKTMKRKVDAARLLCWQAAWLYDQGRDNSREASMAKALGAKVAMEVCAESLEIGASVGISDGGRSLLDRAFRNVKVFNVAEGTGDIQRLTVLSSLLRNARSSVNQATPSVSEASLS
jgi:acyl-CoA dehydrogenase